MSTRALSARQQSETATRASRHNWNKKDQQKQATKNSDVDMDRDAEVEKQATRTTAAASKRKSRIRKHRQPAQSSSASSFNDGSISSRTTKRNTRSITARAKAIITATKVANAASLSKKRNQQKRRRQHENDPDTPYRPYSYIGKSYPNDKSMQALKKQKREETGPSAEATAKIHSGEYYERKESDPVVEMTDNSQTTKRSKSNKFKSKKKRGITFQVCDRDCLGHMYSYLTKMEFATVILVSRHWNHVGSMRSCWPPYTRETILHRYVNSIVGAGEYDDSVLHPRRLEPKGIFDLQRLIRHGGAYSQVNDLSFDEEYYANPSPLIELTTLKNLTSLRYTIEDVTQLNLLEPFAEVMSQRLLVLQLIINRETEEDERDDEEYKESRMTRHEMQFAPIGLLVKLRVLVTNTLPPDPLLVKLHSLEFLHCPIDCHLHPYTARVLRYLSVRHHLRHVSLGGSFVSTVDGVREALPNGFARMVPARGRATSASNFIAILCQMPWKETMKLMDEVVEELEEEKEEHQIRARPPRALQQPKQYPWYVDPIPADEVRADLPIAQLTSLWLGKNHDEIGYMSSPHGEQLDLNVNDFISIFSMSTLRNLKCQVVSKRYLFPAFAASDASSSIAATQVESLDLKVGSDGDLSGLSTFPNLHTLRLSFAHRYEDIDLSGVFPSLTRLRELSLSTVSSNYHIVMSIAQSTWSSLHHLRELRRFNFHRRRLHSNSFNELFKCMLPHLAQLPQLSEVHWHERREWQYGINTASETLPQELIHAICTSSSWKQLHLHLSGLLVSNRSAMIPVLQNALAVLTPEMTSNPHVQRFRLLLYDKKDRLQSISRVAMDDDAHHELESGWKVVDNRDTDAESEDEDDE